VHVRLRRRISLVAATLCVIGLTACARTDNSPRSTHKQDSEFTSSSDNRKPAKRVVCSLLTAEERQALAGKTMDVVIPVNAAAGTQECQWVHSLQEATNAVIRLVAFNAHAWAKVARTQVLETMRNPRLSAATVVRLQAASRKLAEGPQKLTTAQICDIYWVLAKANGFQRGQQVVFGSMIGRMRAAYATGCGDGILTLIGYGEYGLHTSLPLYMAIVDLRQTAQERASEKFGDAAEAKDSDSKDASTESPTDKPSAKKTAKSGSSE
jgi:hypothetical protein